MRRIRLSAPIALASVVVGLAGASPARAAPAEPAPRPLRYDLTLDLAVTDVGLAAWVLSETLFKPALAPARCRWCEPDRLDAGARDALVWDHPRTADVLSSVADFGLLTGGLVAYDLLAARGSGDVRAAGPDLLVIAEAVVLSADLNQGTKFSVGRARPYVVAQQAQAQLSARSTDDNVSFYSGHAAFAFSAVTATGTVAAMRGYKSAPAIFAIGLPAAALIGYLRIGADKHYLSDVATGAVVGSAVGFAVPWLFHRAETADVP